jgi:UrcA family protein
MKTRSAILAAALGAALATPALADTPTASIRTSDLNLATAQGQEQLDRRIDTAARAMCGIADIRTGTILQGNKQKQCFEQARVTARRQVAAQIAHNDASGG